VPPTDASTDAATAPATGLGAEQGPGQDSDSEDTLDLRLPDEFLALIAEEAGRFSCTRSATARSSAEPTPRPRSATPPIRRWIPVSFGRAG
jgi:hypothetical protein